VKAHGVDCKRESASAFVFVKPLQYTVLKLYSCIARAQWHSMPLEASFMLKATVGEHDQCVSEMVVPGDSVKIA